MNKDEILEISRRENKNRDFAELDLTIQAGNLAGRVGACVCCLIFILSRYFTNTFLYSPWIIYFSILGTHYLVKFGKIRRKTDLFLCIVYFAVCLLALVFFVLRLREVEAWMANLN